MEKILEPFATKIDKKLVKTARIFCVKHEKSMQDFVEEAFELRLLQGKQPKEVIYGK